MGKTFSETKIGQFWTNNFGLNDADIERIFSVLETKATRIQDNVTLDVIKDIEAGNLDFEIRAEILMSLRSPEFNSMDKDWIKENVKLLDGITLNKPYYSAPGYDKYAVVPENTHCLLTYREACAIRDKMNHGGNRKLSC